MTEIRERTVLFADLRGSTALFETLGNAEATTVVTHTVSLIGQAVDECNGRLVKTLGDGLMAVFDASRDGVKAAVRMHELLARVVSRGKQHGASPGLRALRMQVALARGEVVEMGGDCFGDAVNVAARLLDHAGDNETLITAEVLVRSAQPAEAALSQPRPHRGARSRRAGPCPCAGSAQPTAAAIWPPPSSARWCLPWNPTASA